MKPAVLSSCSLIAYFNKERSLYFDIEDILHNSPHNVCLDKAFFEIVYNDADHLENLKSNKLDKFQARNKIRDKYAYGLKITYILNRKWYEELLINKKEYLKELLEVYPTPFPSEFYHERISLVLEERGFKELSDNYSAIIGRKVTSNKGVDSVQTYLNSSLQQELTLLSAESIRFKGVFYPHLFLGLEKSIGGMLSTQAIELSDLFTIE